MEDRLVIKNADHMEKAVEHLQEYMNTYTNQFGYREYDAKTLINDVLYGLAVSINENEYRFADGFTRFKEDLLEFLTK